MPVQWNLSTGYSGISNAAAPASHTRTIPRIGFSRASIKLAPATSGARVPGAYRLKGQANLEQMYNIDNILIIRIMKLRLRVLHWCGTCEGYGFPLAA